MGDMTQNELTQRRRKGQTLLSQGGDWSNALRVAVLSSFNLDSLPAFLVEALDRKTLSSRVWMGPFGQMAQTVLRPDSELYSFQPGLVVVVPAVEDLLSPLFERPGSFSPEGQQALVEQRLGELEGLVRRLLDSLPDVTVVLVTFGTDRVPGSQVLCPLAADRGLESVLRFLDGIRRLATLSPRARVADWDWETRG